MNTVTIRPVAPTSHLSADALPRDDREGPVFPLVRPTSAPSAAHEPSSFEDETTMDAPDLPRSRWRRFFGFLVVVGALVGSWAIIHHADAEEQALDWASFGHAATLHRWGHSVRLFVSPDAR